MRSLGSVGGHRRCAVDDPNGVVINIATPGWNEYEEEVNCPKPTAKAARNVGRTWMISMTTALVMAVLSLL